MNAHQRRIAWRRTKRRIGFKFSEYRTVAPEIGNVPGTTCRHFAERHRDVTVFTLDPTQPTRKLFDDGVRNAIARSGFE